MNRRSFITTISAGLGLSFLGTRKTEASNVKSKVIRFEPGEKDPQVGDYVVKISSSGWDHPTLKHKIITLRKGGDLTTPYLRKTYPEGFCYILGLSNGFPINIDIISEKKLIERILKTHQVYRTSRHKEEEIIYYERLIN